MIYLCVRVNFSSSFIKSGQNLNASVDIHRNRMLLGCSVVFQQKVPWPLR